MSKAKTQDHRVICGDCEVEMEKLPENSVSLIIADSPYNIGKSYHDYDDNKPQVEFLNWVRSWLICANRVLHKHGSMWIFAPDEWVSDVDMLCRELKLWRRGWIVWAYTFGVANQRNFSRAHTHILYYTKSKTRFTFNDGSVRVPSARQLVYNDSRQNPKGKLPDNVWCLLREQLEPYMTPDKDVWLESRICGTFKERCKHSPNQIPVPIMERIILACSNVGDLVLDPFCGTGSSGVASVMHDRSYFGIDISTVAFVEAAKRIAEAKVTFKK